MSNISEEELNNLKIGDLVKLGNVNLKWNEFFLKIGFVKMIEKSDYDKGCWNFSLEPDQVVIMKEMLDIVDNPLRFEKSRIIEIKREEIFL